MAEIRFKSRITDNIEVLRLQLRYIAVQHFRDKRTPKLPVVTADIRLLVRGR
jgi:hypothetical protein